MKARERSAERSEGNARARRDYQPFKIWIGGTGERKLLRLVAEWADGWNLLPGDPLPEVKKKVEVLRCHERQYQSKSQPLASAG